MLLAVAMAGCGVSSDVSLELGARCDTKDECAERCLAPSGDYPGGMCTVSCASDADCPDGAACVDEEGGVCLFACASAPNCEFLGDGWTCTAVDARGGGQVMACRGN
jgi:hypothetical protein